MKTEQLQEFDDYQSPSPGMSPPAAEEVGAVELPPVFEPPISMTFRRRLSIDSNCTPKNIVAV